MSSENDEKLQKMKDSLNNINKRINGPKSSESDNIEKNKQGNNIISSNSNTNKKENGIEKIKLIKNKSNKSVQNISKVSTPKSSFNTKVKAMGNTKNIEEPQNSENNVNKNIPTFKGNSENVRPKNEDSQDTNNQNYNDAKHKTEVPQKEKPLDREQIKKDLMNNANKLPAGYNIALPNNSEQQNPRAENKTNVKNNEEIPKIAKYNMSHIPSESGAPQNENFTENENSVNDNSSNNDINNKENAIQKDDNIVNMPVARYAKNTTKGAIRSYQKGKKIYKTMKLSKYARFIPAMVSAGVVALILFIVVGFISFFMNMPGMVRDKIDNYVLGFFEKLKGLIYGQDLPSEKEVLNLANYLNSVGYDLEYTGLATSVEKDENGKIVDMESKYLLSYISADNRSYLIANQNMNALSLWENASELLSDVVALNWDDTNINESWGTGMIMVGPDMAALTLVGVLLDEATDELIDEIAGVAVSMYDWVFGEDAERNTEPLENVKALENRIVINRDANEMIISKTNIILNSYLRNGYDAYSYSLEEWTDRYGTPTELFLTLHLATRAPEFAYKIATTYDTKLFMEAKELSKVKLDVVYVVTNSKGYVKVGKDGLPVMVNLSELSTEEIKSVLKKSGLNVELTDTAVKELVDLDGKNVDAFTPYITRVQNHWYYKDVIFQTNDKIEEELGYKVDVYEERELKDYDDGRIRYYLYTKTTNPDAEIIKNETEEPKEEDGTDGGILGSGSILGSLFDGVFGGLMSGIDEILDVPQQWYDATIGKVTSWIKDNVPTQVLQALEDGTITNLLEGDWLKDGITMDTISNIKFSDIKDVMDTAGIVSSFNIPGLNIDAFSLVDGLSLGDIGELPEKLGEGIENSLENIEDYLEDGFQDVIDWTETTLTDFTDDIVNGMEGMIENLQDTMVKSASELFNFQETAIEDIERVMTSLMEGVPTDLINSELATMLDGLDQELLKQIDGKFDETAILALTTQLSRQYLGVDSLDLENIVKGDTDQIESTGKELVGLVENLDNTRVELENLSMSANKLSKDLTGVDISKLKDILKKSNEIIESADKGNIKNDEMLELINKEYAFDEATVIKLNELLDKHQNMYKQIKTDTNELNIVALQKLENELISNIDEIENIAQFATTDMPFDYPKLLNEKVRQLKYEQNIILNNLETLDRAVISNVNNSTDVKNLKDFEKLVNDFIALDPKQGELAASADELNKNLDSLDVENMPNSVEEMLGAYNSASEANNELSKYLSSKEKEELLLSLTGVNKYVEDIKNITNNLNSNNILDVVKQVPGIKGSELANFSTQIEKLANGDLGTILDQIEKETNLNIGPVTDLLEKNIVENIKDKILKTVSEEVINKMKEDTGFVRDMQLGMVTPNDGGENGGLTGEEEQQIEQPEVEYSTGFYIRETREKDYFQVAEPIRVLYDSKHWQKLFLEDQYIILDDNLVNREKLEIDTEAEGSSYIYEDENTLYDTETDELIDIYTIYEAMQGDIENGILAMLEGINTSSKEYLIRYFKELFTDFDWIFNGGVKLESEEKDLNDEIFGWLFYTYKTKEYVNSELDKYINTYVSEYEPYTWSNNKVGYLPPFVEDEVYGYPIGLSIVSPVNGMVVEKIEPQKLDNGEMISGSITIEVQNSGDENADGMRVILMGGDYSKVNIGDKVEKPEIVEIENEQRKELEEQLEQLSQGELYEQSSLPRTETGTVLGTTTDEPIKVIILNKDRTMVDDVSKYIVTPFDYLDEGVVSTDK